MAPRFLPLALAVLATTAIARAQEPTFAASVFAPPAPASLFTWASPSDALVLSPSAASLPFRLSLLSAIYPMGPAFGPGGCAGASALAAGTILPTQPYMQFQLTPRLVLHGFSDLGCPGDPFAPLDAGAGGGLTYALPLRPNQWLVASGGLFGIPGSTAFPPRTAAAGGLDLVIQSPKSGHVLAAGVGVSSTGRGVRVVPRVGGTF